MQSQLALKWAFFFYNRHMTISDFIFAPLRVSTAAAVFLRRSPGWVTGVVWRVYISWYLRNMSHNTAHPPRWRSEEDGSNCQNVKVWRQRLNKIAMCLSWKKNANNCISSTVNRSQFIQCRVLIQFYTSSSVQNTGGLYDWPVKTPWKPPSKI